MDVVSRIVCDHRAGSPLVGYTSFTCPMCLAKNVRGDFSIGSDGKIQTTGGFSALKQQMLKILTENKRASGYGFDYRLLAGVIDPGTLSAIKAEVIRCLSYLKYTQQREKYDGFTYLPSEELASLDTVAVAQDSSDPRRVYVNVTAVAVSGKKVDVVVPLRR